MLVAYFFLALWGGLSGQVGFDSEGFLYSQDPFIVVEGKVIFRYTLFPSLWIDFDGSLYRTFEKDTLSYRDPFSKPEYYPYSFDKQPVMTHYRLFEVRFLRGLVSFQHKSLVIRVGRDTINWPSMLFFYGNGYPLDFLYDITYKRGPLSFETFNAGLMDTFDLKRLAAQLVVLNPLDGLTLYFAEGVIYTRPNLLKYINPVGFYYVIQRTSDDGPENLMGLVGLKYKNVRFFFLNDDFIIDRGGTSKYGTEVGIKFKNLDFSFIRIPRYTYTHYTDTNNWAINNVPIGYPYGPDVLDFYLKSEFKKWKMELAYLNHGEGKMTEHWLHSGMPKNPPVPSGVVERILGITVRREIAREKEIGIFLYRFKNYQNIPGRRETRIGVYFRLRIRKEIQ